MKIIQCWEIPNNGIPVFYQPDRGSNTISVFVKVGSGSDPPGVFEGRAHVFEHVASNRSPGLLSDELQGLLRAYSANHWREAGIWTGYMNTSYGCGSLRRRDYIMDLFPLFAKMVTDPLITEEILNIERGAILTEWALHGEDNIENRLNRRLLALIYKKNPVLIRMDCNPEHLMAPETLGHLKKFHQDYYVASNIAVIILGPDKDKVKQMALKAFGDLPAKEGPEISYDNFDIRPYLTGIKRDEFEFGDKENKCFHLVMGFPIDPWGHNLDDATDVLAETLEYFLEDNLRDKNIYPKFSTYHPKVVVERSSFHGLFLIWVPTISIDGAYKAEEMTIKIIKNIREGRVFDFLLERAKNEAPKTKERIAGLKILKRILSSKGIGLAKKPIIDNFMDAFVSQPNILAELITEYYCNGGVSAVIGDLNNFKINLRKVTKNRVVQAACEFLDPDRYAVVIAKPIEPLDFSKFNLL